MRFSILTLGQIAAIPVRLHWSWGLFFLLLVVSLRPIYAFEICGGPALCGVDLGMAALMAALVGGSVLLHELGHALVARLLAMPVRGITLFAFGGLAELEDEPTGPGAEFAIALAGPGVSLLLALIAGLVAYVGAPPAALLGAHLAAANAILALFNLLPAYPMDGGRVLRATIWYLADEPLPAARLAARLGRACGVVIGAGGLILGVAAQYPILGIWALLIGGFVFRTAHLSYRQAQLQSALYAVSVGDLMQHRFRTVGGELTLDQFVTRFVLDRSELGFAVVAPADSGGSPILVGMMTLHNMRRLPPAQWANRRVGETMTPLSQLRTLSAQTPALEALYMLNDGSDDLLPVTDGPRLVGILRRRDLAVFIQVQMARK